MDNIQTFYKPFAQVIPEFHKIAYSIFDKAVRGLEEHDHNSCMELVIVETGQEIYHAEGIDHIVRGGSFFIAPAHSRHSSGIHPRSKHKHFCILIDLGLNRQFLGLESFEVLRRSLSGLPVLTARYDNRFFNNVKALFELVQAKTAPHNAIKAHALLTTILLSIVQLSSKNSTGSFDFPLSKINTFFQSNLSKNLSVDDMAQAVSMPVSSFKKNFRQTTGIAPAEYFLRMKLNKARYMIQCSEMTINEISNELGFNSSQYFATVFKRYHLHSPTFWKKGRQ